MLASYDGLTRTSYRLFVISRSSVQIRASAPVISVSYQGSLAHNFVPIEIRGLVADCVGQ